MVGAARALAAALSLATAANGYWLMGADFITTERIDPIVNPGQVSGHVHSVVGGSNFGFEASTELLTQSQCTSVPIKEDKSNYWFPHLYFQWANGSFSSVNGGAVIYYLFPDKPGATKAFPPNFRMLSGNPRKRSYDPNSHAQQAVDFLCLDFNGQTTRHTGLPDKVCPSGIRSQVNFPSCWNGKDVDSPDHKSHVAFRSGGPDKGECTDPNFPVSLPRIFLEVYWGTGEWNALRSQAMNPSQPFVFSYGDRTGYGNHADFFNGWEDGVLQRAVDGCNCNIYGDPQCCADRGIFTLTKGQQCRITKQVDETTTGMLPKLPGNNPVQEGPGDANMLMSNVIPGRISPVYVYTGAQPTTRGNVVIPATTIGGGDSAPSSTPAISSSSAAAAPSSDVPAPSSSPAAGPSPSDTPAYPAPGDDETEHPAPSEPPTSSPAITISVPDHTPPATLPPSPVVPSPSPEEPAPSPEEPAPEEPTLLPTEEPAPLPTEEPTPLPTEEPAPSPTDQPAHPEPDPSTDVVAPTDAPTIPAPPASLPHGTITLVPAPPAGSPTSAGQATSVRTYISTIKVKPTAGCKKKSHHGHGHHHGHLKPKPGKPKHHYRRRFSSSSKRRYDFAVDDYYYLN
ncbi:WSC domain-containing protein [Coprinopsis cinerea okayama7|uniref:WSC domain-containing protein n=1 Tax=Coprinopsis cinerea (strain Okayama-7 / 130 / ATCC MYA-4618 / FGSC 9003) TaxID=240176 RepID=A8NUX1_COPC7|nr:WSC domain-containing protein [Coprinopsis cinerea okayama7\|eukprot:XP_001836553.1 WSC domain-containing protein [Coprinopsis cinerea okayama7\